MRSDVHFRQFAGAEHEGWTWESKMGLGSEAGAELGSSG